MRMVALVLAMLVSPPAGAQNGAPARLITIGPWIVFCDNTGGCGVSNIAANPGSGTSKAGIPGMCLWQGAPEADEASLSLHLDGAVGLEGEGIVIEPVSGPSEMRVGPVAIARGDGAERHVIRGAELDPLIASLRRADALLIREREDWPVLARIPLTRLDGALRAAESDRKPYQPLPTALLRPFERISTGDMNAATPLLHEHCGNDQRRGLLADGFRLGADLQFWAISCRRAGFYNAITLAMLVGGDGTAQPIILPSVIDHEGVGPDFSNLAIHPDQGVIEDFRKLGGAGDCGIRRRWGWNGTRFELLTEDYMPRCFGAQSAQWLRMHRMNEPGADGRARPPC